MSAVDRVHELEVTLDVYDATLMIVRAWVEHQTTLPDFVVSQIHAAEEAFRLCRGEEPISSDQSRRRRQEELRKRQGA